MQELDTFKNGPVFFGPPCILLGSRYHETTATWSHSYGALLLDRAYAYLLLTSDPFLTSSDAEPAPVIRACSHAAPDSIRASTLDGRHAVAGGRLAD